MKNKGVIISIGLILIIGVLVTVGTRHFVSDGKSQFTAADAGAPVGGADAGAGAAEAARADQMAAAEEGAAVGGDLAGAVPSAVALPSAQEGTDDAASEGAAYDRSGTETETADVESAPGAPAPEAAALQPAMIQNSQEPPSAQAAGAAGTSDGTAVPETAVKTSKDTAAFSVISPLTGSVDSSENSSVSVTVDDYKKRLQDVDSRIQKMKESGVVPNTDTCKNMAEYEYRLWDSELNAIYKDIIVGMNEDEAETLRGEERQWMKSRDENARKAASKYSGGSIESMEYTASLAESTRSRAYQLLEDYGDYLPVTLTIKESDNG